MTDKMTQKSHGDMSKEINKDGVAVRTRGYHIWRVIFCIIGRSEEHTSELQSR